MSCFVWVGAPQQQQAGSAGFASASCATLPGTGEELGHRTHWSIEAKRGQSVLVQLCTKTICLSSPWGCGWSGIVLGKGQLEGAGEGLLCGWFQAMVAGDVNGVPGSKVGDKVVLYLQAQQVCGRSFDSAFEECLNKMLLNSQKSTWCSKLGLMGRKSTGQRGQKPNWCFTAFWRQGSRRDTLKSIKWKIFLQIHLFMTSWILLCKTWQFLQLSFFMLHTACGKDVWHQRHDLRISKWILTIGKFSLF